MTDSEMCCPPLRGEPLDSDEAAALATTLKALSDPTRLRLVSLLLASPRHEACVCDLLPHLDVAQPTVSHHLKVLHDTGILDRERRGNWVYYRLDLLRLAEVSRALAPATATD